MERDVRFKDIVHGAETDYRFIAPKDYMETFDALKEGHFVGQYTLDMPEVGFIGDLRVKAVNPAPIPLTPEQEQKITHLKRPVEKNGTTKTYGENI